MVGVKMVGVKRVGIKRVGDKTVGVKRANKVYKKVQLAKEMEGNVQGVHWVKVEIPVKFSDKVAVFLPLGQKKHIVFQPYHEFWYEIPAIENAVQLLSQSIDWSWNYQ